MTDRMGLYIGPAQWIGSSLCLACAGMLLVGCGSASSGSTSTASSSNGASAPSYYVSCGASSNGTGSASAPFNSLASLAGITFAAGSTIYLNRGTNCLGGEFHPLGSGNASTPITIDAYGSGAVPVINGSGSNVGLLLDDQSYWTIQNIEVTGALYQNIFITGEIANTTFSGFTINNVTVDNNAMAPALNVWVEGSGGLVLEPCNLTTVLSNITINNVTAHNNHQAGVEIGHDDRTSVYAPGDLAGQYETPGCMPGSNPTTIGVGISNVTVENSTMYTNDGSGLEIHFATNVLIENNTFYNNGGPTVSVSDQNGEGAWWTSTVNTTAQYNNSYGNSRGSTGDGGGLDVDDQNSGSIVQYNWLHDNQGYGAAVISTSTSIPTTNTVVRYNIMTNNGTNFGRPYGGPGVYLGSLYGGTIDGVQIYNNTISANTSLGGPGLYANAPFAGSLPNFFKNNLVYRTEASQWMYSVNDGIASDYNIFYTTATGTSAEPYVWNGNIYTTFAAYKSACNCDAHSSQVNPLLNGPTYDSPSTLLPTNPSYTIQAGSSALNTGAVIQSNGGLDFFGNSVGTSSTPNMGAYGGPPVP